MRVYFLGTNGGMPTDLRDTACYFVMKRETGFIVDMGTGFRKFALPEFKEALDYCKHLFVLFSHYHLDHTVGLTYTPNLLAGKTVTFLMPSREISGISGEDFLKHIFCSPLFPIPLTSLPYDFEIAEIQEGEHHFGGVTLNVRNQVHSPFSLAFRFENFLSYHTDTVFDLQNAFFAAGAELLLHGCWALDEDVGNPPDYSYQGHTTARGVGQIASRARPWRCYLIHLPPLNDERKNKAMLDAARHIYDFISLPEDEEWFDFRD